MQHTIELSTKFTLRGALKARFEALGWTQTELAKRAGLNQSVLSQFFAGRCGLRSESLDRLADAMGGWKAVWEA